MPGPSTNTLIAGVILALALGGTVISVSVWSVLTDPDNPSSAFPNHTLPNISTSVPTPGATSTPAPTPGATSTPAPTPGNTPSPTPNPTIWRASGVPENYVSPKIGLLSQGLHVSLGHGIWNDTNGALIVDLILQSELYQPDPTYAKLSVNYYMGTLDLEFGDNNGWTAYTQAVNSNVSDIWLGQKDCILEH